MKSYVTVEQNQCPICCKTFDTGNILLDQRLRECFEHKTLTGNSLCQDCSKLHSDGYIALVGCDESKSKVEANGNIKSENAYRTGQIAHVKKEVWPKIFNSEAPNLSFIFCNEQVIEILSKKVTYTI